MSGAFYHYQQRCTELEKQLADMTAERNHYFTVAEDYRSQLARLSAEVNESTDPIQETIATAVTGKSKVTASEIASSMGIDISRGALVRIGLCLRRLGWTKTRSPEGDYVYCSSTPSEG